MAGASDEVKEQVRERYLTVARELSQKDLAPDQVARKTARKVWQEFSYDNRTLRKWTEDLREDGAFVGEAEDQQQDTDSVKQTKSSQLTDDQKHLIHLLPAEQSRILDKMVITEDMLTHHINRLEERDVVIEHDDDAGVYYLPDQPEKRRLSTKAKQSITREANEFRTEQEAALLRRLKPKPPLNAPKQPDPNREDMVVSMADTHIGDVVEDQSNREVFNPKIAAASIQHLTEKAIYFKQLEGEMVDFQDVHLFWGGDHITGTAVYSGQVFDVKLTLKDQLALAVEMMVQQVKTLAEHFETVHICAVPGNHGMERGSYRSGEANMDLIGYLWIQDRLIESDYDNIDMALSDGKHYRNTTVRGHNYHLRHGQHERVHASATSKSKSEQRGLYAKHGFDVQIRGHWHQYRCESTLNQFQVVTLPSPKPGDDFAEKIDNPDCSMFRQLGTIWRASDQRAKIGGTVIDDQDLDVSEADVPSITDIRNRAV